ncbi:hypothetical protein ANO14919_115830 [Xylariales sp. No.14919]|nr:hypothetical protein ANO14919_115830 [Xylariales sp. No.14919]
MPGIPAGRKGFLLHAVACIFPWLPTQSVEDK